MLCRRGQRAPAFSLLEVVVVIVILSVVALIAIPRISRGAEGAHRRAFLAEMRVLITAFEEYHLTQGAWPATNTPVGGAPSEMKGWLPRNMFDQQTPLGGRWDYHAGANGVVAAVGVSFAGSGDAPVIRNFKIVDYAIDDGMLNSGAFRTLGTADAFYFIFETSGTLPVDAVLDANLIKGLDDKR